MSSSAHHWERRKTVCSCRVEQSLPVPAHDRKSLHERRCRVEFHWRQTTTGSPVPPFLSAYPRLICGYLSDLQAPFVRDILENVPSSSRVSFLCLWLLSPRMVSAIFPCCPGAALLCHLAQGLILNSVSVQVPPAAPAHTCVKALFSVQRSSSLASPTEFVMWLCGPVLEPGVHDRGGTGLHRSSPHLAERESLEWIRVARRRGQLCA